MTREKSYFKEEESPTSGSGSNSANWRKKRNILFAVLAVFVVVATIAVVVPVVIVTQKAAGSESQTSDHWCGLMLPAGVNMSEQTPKSMTRRKTCDITGSCWTKEQCYPCFDGPNRDRVGNINDIPVCCPQCTRDGLYMQWDRCECLNNK